MRTQLEIAMHYSMYGVMLPLQLGKNSSLDSIINIARIVTTHLHSSSHHKFTQYLSLLAFVIKSELSILWLSIYHLLILFYFLFFSELFTSIKYFSIKYTCAEDIRNTVHTHTVGILLQTIFVNFQEIHNKFYNKFTIILKWILRWI